MRQNVHEKQRVSEVPACPDADALAIAFGHGDGFYGPYSESILCKMVFVSKPLSVRTSHEQCGGSLDKLDQ